MIPVYSSYKEAKSSLVYIIMTKLKTITVGGIVYNAPLKLYKKVKESDEYSFFVTTPENKMKKITLMDIEAMTFKSEEEYNQEQLLEVGAFEF